MDRKRVLRRGRGSARAGVVQVAADPSGAQERAAVARGFPDLGRPEVAAVGVRVADVLDQGEGARVHEPSQAVAGGVQADRVVEPEDTVPGNADRGPETVVVVVLEGDEGIEAVVAPRQLHDDEDPLVLFRGGGARERGAHEEGRGEPAEGQQAYPLRRQVQEFAAGGGQEGSGGIGGHGKFSTGGTRESGEGIGRRAGAGDRRGAWRQSPAAGASGARRPAGPGRRRPRGRTR